MKRLQDGPTQKNTRLRWKPDPSSHITDKSKNPQPGLVIRNQNETRVSEGHVNTRFFIISDIHTNIFAPEEVPEEPALADVMICCGDLTENSELDEYKSVINMLSRVTAPLKLVIAGNHDGTLDSEGFWDANNWRYRRWPRRRSDRAARLFGNKGEARQLLERAGFIVLDQGHHEFSLGNGAELKVYASPATPRRTSRYRAFQYKKRKRERHGFRIDQDVDVAITHGPPKGIRDPDPLGMKYRGCDDLFESIARARPRLHCFGHNHGGWGATLVEWKDETGEEQPKTKESTVHHEKGLMSLEDIDPAVCRAGSRSQAGDRLKMELAKTRCAPTSHCAGDDSFVQKGKHTLFVNASWSKIDKSSTRDYTQWPWLVDIELPRQRDSTDPASADGAGGVQTSKNLQDRTKEGAIEEKSSAESHATTVEQLVALVRKLKTSDTDNPERVSPGQKTVGQHPDLAERAQGGSQSSPEPRTKKGVYGFRDQKRNMEVSHWGRTTSEAEQETDDESGQESSSTQRPPSPPSPPSSPGSPIPSRMRVIKGARPRSPSAGSPRSQGHGEQSPPGKRHENRRYGFSKGGDRAVSVSWRQNSGAEEGTDSNSDSSKPSSGQTSPGRKGGGQGPDMKHPGGGRTDDQCSKGKRGVYGFGSTSNHRDMDSWGRK